MDFGVYMVLSFGAMMLGAATGLGIFFLLCRLRDKLQARRMKVKVD